MQLQNVYHEDGHRTYKRAAGRERRTTRERTRRAYITMKPPELASTSSCSRRLDKVHAENIQNSCRGWTALAVQTSLNMFLVGRAEIPLKGALACIASVHPPCILNRAANCRRSLAPPLSNLLSLWVRGTAAPNLLSLPDHLGNKTPWRFKHLPL